MSRKSHFLFATECVVAKFLSYIYIMFLSQQALVVVARFCRTFRPICFFVATSFVLVLLWRGFVRTFTV